MTDETFDPAESDAPDSPTFESPLTFLVGDWEGEGVGGAPGADDFAFGVETSFAAEDSAVLAYRSRLWSIETGAPVAHEAGFWRALPDHQVELVVAHAGGFVEVSLGSVAFTRIETVSDVVARGGSAEAVTAVRRLYGMVGEDLLFAVDLAAVDAPLAPRFSGRLRKVQLPG